MRNESRGRTTLVERARRAPLVLAVVCWTVWSVVGGTCLAARVLTGEVATVAADGRAFTVRLPGGEAAVVSVGPGCLVRRNGQVASLAALRPVALGFAPDVRVWLADDGTAFLVEGFYEGCEALVKAAGGEGALLELFAGGQASGEEKVVAPDCPVQKGTETLPAGALRPGQWVYVLFGLDGRVKKLALPG